MDSNVKIDRRLADAVRIAVRDFGEGILAEERLMGVLKDYQGFRTFQQGEFIVRTLISDGTLSRLYVRSKTPGAELDEHLNRETQRIARQYGFSFSLIQTVLLSFIDGFGGGINISEISDTTKYNKHTANTKSKSTVSLVKSEDTAIKINKNKNQNSQNNPKSSSKNDNAPAGQSNSANPPKPANSTSLNPWRPFFLVCSVLLIVVFSPFFVKWLLSEGKKEDSGEFAPEVHVNVDSVNDTSFSSFYQSDDTIPSISPEATVNPTDFTPEEKPESKKKPIDPRFQYPDGRYKQPSEYMKYFNEDDDDEDDAYEEGYEDGYDDALDEL